MIQVETGGLTLLESVTFVMSGLGETRIKVSSPNESLTFVLTFVEQPGQPPGGLKWELVPPDLMRIEFSNWDAPFPGTLLEPAKVGSFDHRALYVLFSVAKVGSQRQIRNVTFSTYLGEEVRDGAA